MAKERDKEWRQVAFQRHKIHFIWAQTKTKKSDSVMERMCFRATDLLIKVKGTNWTKAKQRRNSMQVEEGDTEGKLDEKLMIES